MQTATLSEETKPALQSKIIIGISRAALPIIAARLKSFFGVDITNLLGPLTAGLINLVGLIGVVLAVISRFKKDIQPITLTGGPVPFRTESPMWRSATSISSIGGRSR